MQEQLPRIKKPAMRHTVSGDGSHSMPLRVNGTAVIKCTEIVPGNFQHTTHMDVGSAERKMQERFSADPHGRGECGKCRSGFLPTHMARIVPTILLHFLHPWRSDVGSAENASLHGWTDRYLLLQYLHFRHPWRSY